MPKNKQALIRYTILDKCLSNPYKRYTFNDLLNACNEALMEVNPASKGISERTLRGDLQFMRSPEGGNAPIETYDFGSLVYYRYGEKGFSIHNQPFNQAEVEQLKAAIVTLSKIQGLPQFNWVSELTTKLQQNFLLEKTTQPIISFDNNIYLKGIDYLGELFHHILYQHVLKVTYHSFKSDADTDFVIHPYHLREYNNRWFLFGRSNTYGNLTNLALDRIIDIKEEAIPFVPNDKWDFNEYFDDIIGVTIMGGSPQEVKLAFNKQAAPYILSKPLHGSQRKLSQTDEELIICLKVCLNYELESVILSFGDRVRVLEPENLRLKILERLANALKRYN